MQTCGDALTPTLSLTLTLTLSLTLNPNPTNPKLVGLHPRRPEFYHLPRDDDEPAFHVRSKLITNWSDDVRDRRRCLM